LFNLLEPLQALSNICYSVFKDQFSTRRREATSKESMRNDSGVSIYFLSFFRRRTAWLNFNLSGAAGWIYNPTTTNRQDLFYEKRRKKKPLQFEGAFQIISAATYFPT
jgi:hypothetical protein